ncbi:MAG: hypothetical protein ACW98U_01720 [Candidatus Thorarchaeota archaeon]|jgi:hypothetical protein
MSQRSKRDKRKTKLEGFQFDPSDLDLKFTKSLMTVFDGYRINRCYDLGWVDKRINEGKAPQSFTRQWGTLRAVLHRLAAIGPKVEGVEKMLNTKQYFSFASMAVITIVVPLILLTWVFQLEILQNWAIPLALLAVGMMMVNFLVGGWYNRKVAWAIHDYIEAHPALVSRERTHLQKWVQLLINHAARLMRKAGEDPEKNLIKFFTVDYTGIIVDNEPGGFRKHYTVIIRRPS